MASLQRSGHSSSSPPLAILRLARTSFCAVTVSGSTNARAIFRVVRPHSARNARATCADCASAGWQHVNIRLKRSSGLAPAATSCSSVAGASSAANNPSLSVYVRRSCLSRSSAQRRENAPAVTTVQGFKCACQHPDLLFPSVPRGPSPRQFDSDLSQGLVLRLRPYLDGSVRSGRNLGYIDQIVAAQLFFGFRERAVRRERLAVPNAHGCCRGNG